ncbi:hypothetical protein C5S35_13730, partial [Candidatus Methanophagaceae archaeon]
NFKSGSVRGLIATWGYYLKKRCAMGSTRQEIKSFGDKIARKERYIVKGIKNSINDIKEIIKSRLGKK